MALVEQASQTTLANSYEALDRPDAALGALRRANELEEEMRPPSLDASLIALESASGQTMPRGQYGLLLGVGILALCVAGTVLWERGFRIHPAAATANVPGGTTPPAGSDFWSMCAHCKKVRDEHGHWRPVEEPLYSRAGVTTSHGICPECVDLNYLSLPPLRPLDKDEPSE